MLNLTTNQRSLQSGLGDWEVESLRATTFISARSIEQVAKDEWWASVAKRNPDGEQVNYQLGVKEQRGIFNDYDLRVHSRADRADWIFTAEQQTPGESQQNTLGSLPNALIPFLGVVKNWLKVCPTTTRLAFGANLTKQVSDETSGQEEILQFLPYLNLKLTDISDFFFQINRRRKSASSKNMIINRISKWSVIQTSMVTFTVNNTGASISTPEQEKYSRKLVLDINTVPSDRNIPKSDTYHIFKELTECGNEIAAKGDIP